MTWLHKLNKSISWLKLPALVGVVAATLLLAPAARATLTKSAAYAVLKSNGIRWAQTELLPSDAANLRDQAESALKPKMGFVARQLISRVDLHQFGIDDAGPLNLITYGAAVAEFQIPLLDTKSLARVEAAKLNESLSRENMLQYQSDLTYAMLLAFLNTQRLSEKLKVIDSNIARNNEILRMAQAKERSGTGIPTDVLRAKGLVSLENMKRLDTETNFKKSLRDLATLLGQNSIEDKLEPLKLKEIDIDAKDRFAKTGVDERPDVRAADISVRAARQLKDASESEFDPKVELVGDLGVGGVSMWQGQGANLVGALGIQVKFPVFDGHYFSTKVQQAELQVNKAQLQARHTKLDAESQIYNALDQLDTSRAAADLASEQVQLATDELNIARKRFTTGATSGVDLASSQANLSTALTNYIDIVFGYEASKVTYFRSIGEFDTYFELENRK